ncbi:calcium/sodium antiporter [Barnesiella sp. WM24]|uniref:calcium/sodium antiporter n=1 Tax=Barnesiella sp. WM24 TaxID=2558278 RepID=UPI001071A2B0|nr:calcium/sodium antiporter [Barnesiella sp. WM24]TFU93339.1 calcium/sodium antiporter [Barnesiella sp. WM24]
MAHDIIFLILGIILIIAGGNYLTDGASAVARHFKVSNLVIGLTVVAFGSSTPDFVVCLTSTLSGKSQLALGDVVGANIFDILLVVGIVALVNPIHISKDMLWKDLPMLALASLALFFCGDDRLFDGTADYISRTDGLMLLAFFAIFMAYTFEMAREPQPLVPANATENTSNKDAGGGKGMKMWLAAVCIAGGLAALVVGGNWIVDGASGIALKAGLSEGMVGLTIVAIGSSVPDLATSVVAAVKKQPGIALGNVVGACIFNVFFIIGLCATIRPLDTGTISLVDFSTLVGGSLLLWLFGQIIGKRVITRGEGVVLALGYVAYITYLIVKAVG